MSGWNVTFTKKSNDQAHVVIKTNSNFVDLFELHKTHPEYKLDTYHFMKNLRCRALESSTGRVKPVSLDEFHKRVNPKYQEQSYESVMEDGVIVVGYCPSGQSTIYEDNGNNRNCKKPFLGLHQYNQSIVIMPFHINDDDNYKNMYHIEFDVEKDWTFENFKSKHSIVPYDEFVKAEDLDNIFQSGNDPTRKYYTFVMNGLTNDHDHNQIVYTLSTIVYGQKKLVYDTRLTIIPKQWDRDQDSDTVTYIDMDMNVTDDPASSEFICTSNSDIVCSS